MVLFSLRTITNSSQNQPLLSSTWNITAKWRKLQKWKKKSFVFLMNKFILLKKFLFNLFKKTFIKNTIKIDLVCLWLTVKYLIYSLFWKDIVIQWALMKFQKFVSIIYVLEITRPLYVHIFFDLFICEKYIRWTC